MSGKSGLFRQLVVSLCILATLVAGGLLLMGRAQPVFSEAPPAPKADSVTVSTTGQHVLRIATEPVRAEALERSIKATGLISYPADETVKISPRVTGRIRQVFAHVGDHVAAGETLAILDSVDAAAALTTARQNENKLRLAKANLERQQRLYHLGTPDVSAAQASLEQAEQQQEYARAALAQQEEQARIGGFTQKPLEDAQNAVVAARTALRQAEADDAQAQKELDRTGFLEANGIASKRDLANQQDIYDKAKAGVEGAQESLKLAEGTLERERKAFSTGLYANQQLETARNTKRQADLGVQAAERALRLAKAAVLRDLQQAQSDYEVARFDRENSWRVLKLLGQPGEDGAVRVQSPISGVVVERNVNPGQVVDQSQMTPWQMFTICNTESVWVDADVYEKDINAVRPGEKVTIHVAALPSRVFAGTVRRIAPTLDAKTRAVKVRAEITNPGGLLKDGMFADVTIERVGGHSALVIPLSAVQHDGDKEYVYVAEGGKYRRRAVQLGTQIDDHSVVKEGLRAGEQVVTRGAIFLGGENNSD